MQAGLLVLSGCTVDLGRRRVLRDGEEIVLTTREADLLGYLADRAGSDVSMEELHRRVWGHGPRVTSRAAFHTARRLRAKIERDPHRPEHLLAVHGVGFRLALPAGPAPPSPPPDRPPLPAAPPLPPERDAFVGREEAIDQLRAAFAAGRLVTITGFGGMGKTRLACAFAHRTAGEWPGGVWFCGLAAARDLHGIAVAVAAALGTPLLDDPVPQIGQVLAARGRCLVLLDNFEQVAGCADATVGRWVDLAPEARLLVTSRQLLGLPGERLVPLEGLPTPEAAALLRDRVAAARPGWTPSPDDERELEELATALDGIPLAIELAAPRLRIMGAAELRQRLDPHLGVLASPPGRSPRHATLRAVLAWSWELLAPWERAALAQLSVLEDGFGLRAAEAVLDLAPFPGAPDALDVVQALCDRSLVRRAGGRLSLLAVVRAFAADLLGPRDREAAERRHGRFFAGLGDGTEAGPGADLAPELDNLVVACRRAIDRADPEVAAPTALAAWSVIEARGPWALGADLLDRAAALTDAPRLHLAAANAWHTGGQPAIALGRLERALARAREEGDREVEGRALASAGCYRSELGLPGGRELAEQGLEVLRDQSDVGRATAHHGLGVLLFLRGAHAEARTHLHAAHALFRAAGAERDVARAALAIGQDAAVAGRWDEALQWAGEALACYERAGDLRGQSTCASEIALMEFRIGRLDRAERHLTRAMALDEVLGIPRLVVSSLVVLGRLRQRQGALVEAERHLRAALALTEARDVAGHAAIARSALGDLLLQVGRLDEAREQLEQAERGFEQIGFPHHGAIARARRGAVRVLEGRGDEGEAALEDAAEVLRELGQGPNEAWARCLLGRLRALRGDAAGARPVLEQVLALDPEDLVRGAAQAALALTCDRVDDARAVLDAGEAAVRESGSRLDLAAVLAIRAVIERRADNPEAARRALDRAVAEAAGVGPRSELAQLLALAAPGRRSGPT